MAPPNGLTSHCKLTRWIVLQKARRHRINLLRLLVGTEFQDLFHSPPGVLFTFPSRYLFTIDLQRYLALAVSSAGFPRAIRVPRYSGTEAKKIIRFRVRGYYRLGPGFPASSANVRLCNFSYLKVTPLPYNHISANSTDILGYSRFARRY